MNEKLEQLALKLKGELFTDQKTRILYATDASAYRELPIAVAIPQTIEDIKVLVDFATANSTSLIPRTAGTSLAGQVVGKGIIVDVSKNFNRILEVNEKEKWVRLQPGVVRDELNLFLKPYQLLFGPETSTANRAMIGGMVGNNACGSNSLVYNSTREHLLEIQAILSDGSEATFKGLNQQDFINKCAGETLEAKIYRNINKLLGDPANQQAIREGFPDPQIPRRNTGYAVDLLLNASPFTVNGENFNFCKLLAGSEGTLAFITEIKLNLLAIEKEESALLCAHFNSIDDALRANIIALKYKPKVSELIDHHILDCTKDNIEQAQNRFFVSGEPAAILVIEYTGKDLEEIKATVNNVESEMRSLNLGYHFPLLHGDDMKKVWSLRKAGLGLLSNLPGDEKAVAVIEDTAVAVKDLPNYIRDFNQILHKYNLSAVHYAHAGTGELHLRPILNLKTWEGNVLFKVLAQEIATLVKKYKGSLSGEHGDGRLRGEFITQMIGKSNYDLLRQIKEAWDPKNIFNPNKIIDTPPMNSMLRYSPGQQDANIPTLFRFPGQNILQHAEQCNGSGDCRKSHLAGGTMCPSYMVTRNEQDTTRARANILREMLTHSDKKNKFDHPEIKEVMDLCISCKGCKSECPSNVDMAKLKAEFLQQYYDANGVPFRSRLIAGFNNISKLGALSPKLYNAILKNRLTGKILKNICGFSQERSLPELHTFSLRKWFNSKEKRNSASIGAPKRTVLFFCDEFTNYYDTLIGVKAIRLLEHLGYRVVMPDHMESGRAWISKGLVRAAKKIANKNVKMLSAAASAETPLIGIEPSAILTFRDEYIDLVDEAYYNDACKLAANTFLIDEFLYNEMKAGNIEQNKFTKNKKRIKFHGHCQQKAWSAGLSSQKILSFPENYTVEVITSGCCGMAGSFGYEKEHYELSMRIADLVLLPELKDLDNETIIAATGTSCRHQIRDGISKQALHPVEILYDALAINGSVDLAATKS